MCLIAFDLKFDRYVTADHAFAIRRTVLIPHTLTSRLPERSIIHPSIVKERGRSRRTGQDEVSVR